MGDVLNTYCHVNMPRALSVARLLERDREEIRNYLKRYDPPFSTEKKSDYFKLLISSNAGDYWSGEECIASMLLYQEVDVHYLMGARIVDLDSWKDMEKNEKMRKHGIETGKGRSLCFMGMRYRHDDDLITNRNVFKKLNRDAIMIAHRLEIPFFAKLTSGMLGELPGKKDILHFQRGSKWNPVDPMRLSEPTEIAYVTIR